MTFAPASTRTRCSAASRRIFNHPDTPSYYNKMTHYDMVTGLPALLQVEDRVSMAVSLESRVPLLDHRIADLVASMPPAMKFRGGGDEVHPQAGRRATCCRQRAGSAKDKMGFPVPLHLWARTARGTSSTTSCCREPAASEASSTRRQSSG